MMKYGQQCIKLFRQVVSSEIERTTGGIRLIQKLHLIFRSLSHLHLYWDLWIRKVLDAQFVNGIRTVMDVGFSQMMNLWLICWKSHISSLIGMKQCSIVISTKHWNSEMIPVLSIPNLKQRSSSLWMTVFESSAKRSIWKALTKSNVTNVELKHHITWNVMFSDCHPFSSFSSNGSSMRVKFDRKSPNSLIFHYTTLICRNKWLSQTS